jgi:3-oxo-4-pregnene-20-carboxyl-CoA dehydrogenase beta subunit
VFIDLSVSQIALRDELRAYFVGLISPAEREAMRTERFGTAYRAVVRRMGSDGWLGVGWPAEYGGRGLGQLEQQIFVTEAARADVPLPAVTLRTVGPTVQAHGTAEQRSFFLPSILAGEVHFAIGYSEPDAGTDLAALRTRAVRTGDGYVVNGKKIFTTGAHDADYCDVRVPVTMRVGEENAGWRLITTQLNHERVMLGPAGRIAVLHDRVRSWVVRQHGPDGAPLLAQPDVRRALAQPDVRRALAETAACVRISELLNWQIAMAASVDIADASVTKVFSSEQLQRLGQLMEELVGRHGDPADEETAELARWLDGQSKRNTVLTFGGGVNEIQREFIATAGLGLPRVPR